MCMITTGQLDSGDAMLDSRNSLLVLAPHLSDAERTELARRLFGLDDQLTDNGYTAICECGIEVNISAANEGALVLA